MAKKVFYYSRTGNCARVAHDYAKDGEGHLIQIMDVPEDRYWGALGFLKAAFNTIFKHNIGYKLIGDRTFASTDVFLITPVWAGQVPSTFRSFLEKEIWDSEAKVTVVTVSDSGNGRETFRQIVDLLQKAGIQEIRHRNLKSSETKSPK